MILRDCFYRLFFIYPSTSINGKFARKIEDVDIVKWVGNILRKPEVEVGFVGNSHVMDAIDPKIITILTNKSCFNLALYYIPIPNMIEILQKRKYYPKTIFIDFSTRYSMFNESYLFYEDLTNKKYNLNNETLWDKLSVIAPSLFIPKKYSFLLFRSIKKILQWKKTSLPSIGRYTPFQRLISFRWKLNKHTNHRFVIRTNKKTRIERLTEINSLRKSIKDTDQYCNISNPNYTKGMEILKSYVIEAKKKGSKIILLR